MFKIRTGLHNRALIIAWNRTSRVLLPLVLLSLVIFVCFPSEATFRSHFHGYYNVRETFWEISFSGTWTIGFEKEDSLKYQSLQYVNQVHNTAEEQFWGRGLHRCNIPSSIHCSISLHLSPTRSLFDLIPSTIYLWEPSSLCSSSRWSTHWYRQLIYPSTTSYCVVDSIPFCRLLLFSAHLILYTPPPPPVDVGSILSTYQLINFQSRWIVDITGVGKAIDP